MQAKSPENTSNHPISSRPTLDELRERLQSHRIYAAVDDLESLRRFMEAHVFAVWDFMSLAKRLQREVTCVKLPWMPPASSRSARFINEIVLSEESDLDGSGQSRSHLELYLMAMHEVSAHTDPFDAFLGQLRAGRTVQQALTHCAAPAHVQDFVAETTRVALHGSAHEVASTFLHGREDLIPDMFQRLLSSPFLSSGGCEHLRYYLDRHIRIDAQEHGPAARSLVEELTGEDPKRVSETRAAARRALTARLALWDGVLASIA